MPLPTSKLLVMIEPPVAYVRVVGRAAVEGALGFKALVQRLVKEGVDHFCLDLTECKLMDSTFSGVLGALASDLKSESPDRQRFTLVNPNARILDLLDNLGVLSLVHVLTGEVSKPASGTELAVSPGDSTKSEVADCCLNAHRFLMALKPENQGKFAELTRILEQQKATAANRSD